MKYAMTDIEIQTFMEINRQGNGFGVTWLSYSWNKDAREIIQGFAVAPSNKELQRKNSINVLVFTGIG